MPGNRAEGCQNFPLARITGNGHLIRHLNQPQCCNIEVKLFNYCILLTCFVLGHAIKMPPFIA